MINMSSARMGEVLDFGKVTCSRRGSKGDGDMEGFLKGFNLNYDDTVSRLDIYYGIVKRTILRYQSPVNGLFPVVSSDTEVGSVRESIYCAAAIWSLYQAYR
jgi:phosphorylase kinase alpha/beta subunit